MTYPDSDRPSRFVGEGFRVEPDFRQASGSPEGYPEEDDFAPPPQLALSAAPRALTAAELNSAFDDPNHGDPGRDRLGVHVMWEFVLLIAGAGVAWALVSGHRGALSGNSLRDLMVSATIVGLLALGAGVTMRAGAVNLAIGPIMVVSGLYFGQHTSSGFYQAAGVALAIALGCGLVIALIVTIFHVPGWAASLAAFFGIQVWLTYFPSVAPLSTRYNADAQGYYWFGVFAGLALIGGILGAIRPIRRAVGRFRPIADPADRRGVPAAVITGLAIVGSALLAGLAGIATGMRQGLVSNNDGVVLTGIALGVALLGGTSAFGRRGGIAGTLLAAALFTLANQYVYVHEWRAGELTLIAVTLAVGVLVTRLIERLGRPRGDIEGPTTWVTPSSWTRELTARPSEEPTWVDASDERWGAR
jgi:ribose/xylose/arabinose/galactoside ABC-type transport system permease subunit